jgi:hypothetical protein
LFISRSSTRGKSGDVEETFNDTVGRAILGVGVVVQRRLSVVSRVVIPIGVDDADTRFSLLVALHFGS